MDHKREDFLRILETDKKLTTGAFSLNEIFILHFFNRILIAYYMRKYL